MKAVCSRHEQAYEVAIGCPWCEPACEPAGEPAGEHADKSAALTALVEVPELARERQVANDVPAAPLTPTSQGQGFDSRKLTVDDMTRLSRFYAL